MRYTDQPRPIVTGYSLAQHQRDHFNPGNSPASCVHCDREATYTPTEDVRRDYQPGTGPIRGAVIGLLFTATVLFAVLALINAMAGAYINGWSVWAVLFACFTAVVAVRSTR